MTKELFHPKGLYLLGKDNGYFYSGRKITVENNIAVKKLKKKGKLQNPQTLLPVTFYLLQNH